MKTIAIVNGVVKWEARSPLETKYGPRINVVVTLDSGEEIKLWGNPDDPILTHLVKGQRLTLLQDDKGYKIADMATLSNPTPAPPPPVPPPAPPTFDGDVEAIAHIFEQLRARLPQADAQTWRSLTATIFIQRGKAAESEA